MKIEDIQVIWNEQEEKPSIFIDIEVLHKRLIESDDVLKRHFKFEEITMILIALTFGGALAHEPILFGHDFHQLFSAFAAWTLGGYLIARKYWRVKQEQVSEESISATIALSIKRIRCYIKWQKNTMILFLVMIVSGLLFGSVFGPNETRPMRFGSVEIYKDTLVWSSLAILVPFAIWSLRKDSQKRNCRIERLAELQSQLTAE